MGILTFLIIWTVWMLIVATMVWYDSRQRFDPIPFWKLFLIFEFLPIVIVWWGLEKLCKKFKNHHGKCNNEMS